MEDALQTCVLNYLGPKIGASLLTSPITSLQRFWLHFWLQTLQCFTPNKAESIWQLCKSVERES